MVLIVGYSEKRFVHKVMLMVKVFVEIRDRLMADTIIQLNAGAAIFHGRHVYAWPMRREQPSYDALLKGRKELSSETPKAKQVHLFDCQIELVVLAMFRVPLRIEPSASCGGFRCPAKNNLYTARSFHSRIDMASLEYRVLPSLA